MEVPFPYRDWIDNKIHNNNVGIAKKIWVRIHWDCKFWTILFSYEPSQSDELKKFCIMNYVTFTSISILLYCREKESNMKAKEMQKIEMKYQRKIHRSDSLCNVSEIFFDYSHPWTFQDETFWSFNHLM